MWYVQPMAIAGERPETGVRIIVERDKTREDPPWTYAGAAHLPEASFPMSAIVDAEGNVTVSLAPDAPADLAERVRLIVRAVYRQAKADDEAPAWRIQRWRGEK
jgi:hypothetical protein